MLSGWTLDASTVDRPEDLGGNGVIGVPGKPSSPALGAEARAVPYTARLSRQEK